MSDLRTRIAAALTDHARLDYIDPRKYSEMRCKCGQVVRVANLLDPDSGAVAWSDHVADAVIRELGLTQQWLVDGSVSDGEPRDWELPCETRYTTEWERFDA